MSSENHGSLLSEALQAPDDVSEVCDSEGRLVHIQRDPSYPGAKRAHLDAPLADDRVTQVWHLPASPTRPDFYPPDVPFIRDVSCLVMEGNRGLFVSWKDAAALLSPEKSEAMRTSMPADLSELMSSMHERSPDKLAPADAAELIRLFQERFGDDDVQKWIASGSETELEDRVVTGFDDVARQSVESGWSLLEEPGEAGPPFVIRSETLRKAGMRRKLTLAVMAGVSHITLRDETIGPVASA